MKRKNPKMRDEWLRRKQERNLKQRIAKNEALLKSSNPKITAS